MCTAHHQIEIEFSQRAGLDSEADQTLTNRIFSRMRCLDHSILWRDQLQNALVLTVAPYGDAHKHEAELALNGYLFRHIPQGLGPYPNQTTTQYLVALPHSGEALEVVYSRILK